MEDSNKRTVGIAATAITVIMCGCPGLASLCFGAMLALVGPMPDAHIEIGGNNDPRAAVGLGIVGICVGLLLVVIPAVVGFFTLRNTRPAAAPAVPSAPRPPTEPDEPLPPAI